MRKTLSLVLAAAMLSTTIAACGSSNNTATTTAAATETTAAAETSAAETTAAAGETADASAAQDFAGQTLTISTFSFNAELLQIPAIAEHIATQIRNGLRQGHVLQRRNICKAAVA